MCKLTPFKVEKLKKNLLKWKNDIAQSLHEALSSDWANYDLEGTTHGTFWVDFA